MVNLRNIKDWSNATLNIEESLFQMTWINFKISGNQILGLSKYDQG